MTDQLKDAVLDLGKAFDEFKMANDQRLSAIESGTGLAEMDEKLTKINKDMDEALNLKARLETLETRGNRIGNLQGDEAVTEHREAFKRWMRKGNDDGLAELERKAVTIGTDSEGGYAVPEQIDSAVDKLLRDISPIRAIARVISISTSDFKKIMSVGGTAGGWVDEDDARAQTAASALAAVVPSMGEVYANPASTQQALDDIMFDVEGWIAEEVSEVFAQKEGLSFVSGNGTKQPTGFLAGTPVTTADASRTFGVLQYIASGAAGAWASTDPHNALITTVYTLRQGYRANARWVANSLTLASVRKMKDGDGNLIWQPGLIAGQPQTLMGYPITEAEDMPAIAANSFALAFGDFQRGYLIVDRVGMRSLRDPYTNKPYVHFYTTKRLGGKILNSEAIKLIRFAAS